MPRPFFAFVRHPAAIAELPTYLSDYKLLFHDAAEEYEFAHMLERPGQRGYWLANLLWKSVVLCVANFGGFQISLISKVIRKWCCPVEVIFVLGKDLRKRILASRFQVLKGLCKETCGI